MYRWRAGRLPAAAAKRSRRLNCPVIMPLPIRQRCHVEIRDIHKGLQHVIDAAEITALLPDMSLNHSDALCGMTFTPSGRFLYLAVCDSEGGRRDDAILAYNTNTESLTVFHRLPLQEKDAKASARFGMSYFGSKLYVGAADGAYRIEAGRNTVYRVENDGYTPAKEKVSLPEPVRDIALDMEAQQLYLLTNNGVYRLGHSSDNAQRIYQQQNLAGIGFSRCVWR